MRPNFGKIFIEADSPEFLEKDVQPETELVDLGKLNVADILGEYRKRKLIFDTAPFDPEGNEIRFYPDGYSIWSGFPGAGKTTLLRQLVCHLLRARRKVFIASLEENPIDVFCRLASVALGTDELTEDGLQWCVDCWQESLRLWSYRRGIASHQRIMAVIRVMAREGVTHAVIDSLARLDVDSKDIEAQRLFANTLEATCATAHVHVHLVAHPRKLQGGQQEIDLSDIAGSADIGRLCDNALFIKRKTDDSAIRSDCSPMQICVKKQRHFNGGVPTIEGFFNRRLRQYKPHMSDVEVTRYLPGGAYGEIAYKFDRESEMNPA